MKSQTSEHRGSPDSQAHRTVRSADFGGPADTAAGTSGDTTEALGHAQEKHVTFVPGNAGAVSPDVSWFAVAPWERRKVRMERVRALRAEGMTIPEIAARLGIHHATAWEDLRRLGLNETQSAGRVRHQVMLAAVRELYDRGLFDREIAAQLSVSVDVVRRARYEMRLRGRSTAKWSAMKRAPMRAAPPEQQYAAPIGPMPPTARERRHALMVERDARLAEMFHAGRTAREIADTVGLTVNTVHAKLSTLGLFREEQLDAAAIPDPKPCGRCGLRGEHVCMDDVAAFATARHGGPDGLARGDRGWRSCR